jgi:hypothetical protein
MGAVGAQNCTIGQTIAPFAFLMPQVHVFDRLVRLTRGVRDEIGTLIPFRKEAHRIGVWWYLQNVPFSLHLLV